MNARVRAVIGLLIGAPLVAYLAAYFRIPGVIPVLAVALVARGVIRQGKAFNAWLEEDPANKQGSAEWRAYYGLDPAPAPEPTPDPEPVVVELPPAEVAVIVHREEGAA
jgi:hypothetical protein